MISGNDLEKMRNINIPHNELKELADIKMDSNASCEERIDSFFNNIGNPYCFKINGTVYRIKFSDNQKSLDDCLANYLSNIVEMDN